MQTIDVPQSASMGRYLEQRDYARAYQVACLGVPKADWRALGMEALQVRRAVQPPPLACSAPAVASAFPWAIG
jgi:hypothetical protein